MPELLLNVEQGTIEGVKQTTKNGFNFNSYHGIPYARAPIGLLRFKDPQNPDPWDGVRDAKIEGLECAQTDIVFSQKYTGSEDSLFVNVFTPSSATEHDKLPVMVFIHGGGFRTGSGNKSLYGGDYIVTKNVILVTFNYRVGVLGFLCLNNTDIPGNAGLKDQVYALRWVQRNIKVFGGDPENVTVFGESAGAASVHYLMMSPMASGLFKRSIIQSGSCISNWAIQKDPVDNVLKLAQRMGCKSTRLEEISRFLREALVEDLIDKTYTPFDVPDEFWCLPVIEIRLKGIETFISGNPTELMRSGSYNTVPCINGVNSQEGIVFFNKNFVTVEDYTKVTDLSQLKVDLKGLVRKIVGVKTESTINDICKKIKEFYFKDTEFMEGYINLLTDMQFLKDIDTSINLMKKHSVIYMYNFKYSGSVNLCRGLTDYPYSEAAHADELGYLFKPHINVPEFPIPDFSEKDEIISERLVTMWTNFAKFENPTPEVNEVITELWKPVTMDEMNCLTIDDDMKMTVDPYSQRMGFWKKMLEESNKPTVKVNYDFRSRMSFWNNLQQK